MATMLFFSIIAIFALAGIFFGIGFCCGSLKENRLTTKTMVIVMSVFAGIFVGFPIASITLLITGAMGVL